MRYANLVGARIATPRAVSEAAGFSPRIRVPPVPCSTRKEIEMKRMNVMLGLAAAALLIAPRVGFAQTATVYGQLGNFDVVNNTGHDAHGFEIELEGVQPADVYFSFSMQRYGTPDVSPSPTGTRVRWSSAYDVATQSYGAATIPRTGSAAFGGTCYSWNPATYPTAGCEHFGVSLRIGSPRATYRWLIEDPSNAGTLVAVDPPVPVAQPYYSVPPVDL